MDEELEKLVKQVKEGAKYRTVHPDLVENIARIELKKGRSWKETVKSIRNKLHQIGSAYQLEIIDYERLISEMKTLPQDIHCPEAKRFFISLSIVILIFSKRAAKVGGFEVYETKVSQVVFAIDWSEATINIF